MLVEKGVAGGGGKSRVEREEAICGLQPPLKLSDTSGKQQCVGQRRRSSEFLHSFLFLTHFL